MAKKKKRKNLKKQSVNKQKQEHNSKKTHVKNVQNKVTNNTNSIDQKLTIRSLDQLIDFFKQNKPIQFFLILLCFAVYANGLTGEFVSDDIIGFRDNPNVRDLSGSFRSLSLYQIIPAVSYALFELNPVPLHMWSLYLHSMNTILVLTLISMLFNKKIGLISATLFAVHPINSEALNWISAGAYILNGTKFFIVAILYFIAKNAPKNKQNKYYFTAIGVFVLSYISTFNPWILLFPIYLAIIDILIDEQKITFKNCQPHIIFFTLSLLFGLLMYARIADRTENLGYASPTQIITARSPLTESAPYTTFTVSKLLIWPERLSLYHEGEIFTRFKYNVLNAYTIGLAYASIYLFFKHKRIAGLIFLIFASTAVSYSPKQVAWFIAERYLYIGSVAFVTLIAWGIYKLEKKLKIEMLALILTVLLTSAYGIRTIVRNNDWRTRKTLWEATVREYPNSHRAYNNLGDVYILEGNINKSIEAFTKAIEIKPNYAAAMHNLANSYVAAGNIELAEKLYFTSYELDKTLYQSLFKIGAIAAQQKNYEKAELFLTEALKVNPNDENSKNILLQIMQLKQISAPTNEMLNEN